ncbi:MAG: zinc ribbon domain-containing protein [Candidatus Margulisbacteria bacterium]|jgi:putative FmdB family regulatory protein|nr:zinc ribbon domain-containing protein [Candidatus Margulisiibacteriota bacterium]
MPVFDFACQNCRQNFSELVCGAEQIVCPVCGSAQIRKLFSGFYTISAATRFETNAPDLPSMTQWEKARKGKPGVSTNVPAPPGKRSARRLKSRGTARITPKAAVHKRA